MCTSHIVHLMREWIHLKFEKLPAWFEPLLRFHRHRRKGRNVRWMCASCASNTMTASVTSRCCLGRVVHAVSTSLGYLDTWILGCLEVHYDELDGHGAGASGGSEFHGQQPDAFDGRQHGAGCLVGLVGTGLAGHHQAQSLEGLEPRGIDETLAQKVHNLIAGNYASIWAVECGVSLRGPRCRRFADLLSGS